MSRQAAIKTLVEMMRFAEESRDKIAAADKLLRSGNISRETQEEAIKVLEKIMGNEYAEDRDRVNAADKLKDLAPMKPPTNRDISRQLAAMTDAELDTIISGAELDSDGDPLLE